MESYSEYIEWVERSRKEYVPCWTKGFVIDDYDEIESEENQSETEQ